ncbi:MAG TPA: hypothetical protein VM662_09255 [Sphingomonas sp.]|nr:hypothetical protein [Sphingomonas sp.]
MDPIIRPDNGLLLIALQTAEGAPATLDPALHAVPVEAGSFTYGSPYGNEEANEVNGSLVAGSPLIIGQEVPLSFRSRIKGAGAGVTYTSTVKPPLHAALQACGWRGQFTAAITAAALTAGTTTSATLGTGFTGTAQLYTGMPLVLSGGVGAGQIPLITGYTSGKVATLSDEMDVALDTTTMAGIPANWTYAGTSPTDAASRLTDHPCATVGWYEDGNLYRWQDVRGILDLEGDTARPGFGAFNMSGTYLGSSTVAMPTNAVIASHSAPVLAKGAAAPAAALINRKELPISRWALRNGGNLESIVDPNTPFGFGPSQIARRRPTFEADPLRTLVSTRDAIAEIAAAAAYPIALRFGQTAGNRWSLVGANAQPIQANPEMRGQLRSDAMVWQMLSAGRDAQARDTDRLLCFY